MTNTGKEYEIFVANLQQALLNAECITTQKNIKVEVDKKIVDSCGVERQFDIFWEYELGGLTYRTVIECKDYSSNISVDKIDALIGKTRDIPDLRPVFATQIGYQSGAKNKAKQNMIELLVVREQNDSDWTDEDGRPLPKQICFDVRVGMPAHIHKFDLVLDGQWVKDNTDIDTDIPMSPSGSVNEIFVHDIAKGEQYPLQELANKLRPLDHKESGDFEIDKEFEDAVVHYRDLNLKLIGYKIGYSVSKPISLKLEIDYSKELVGVIEYLQKGTKKSIFRNGVIA